MDVFPPQKRSEIMSKIRSRYTKPEEEIAALLDSLGVKYERKTPSSKYFTHPTHYNLFSQGLSSEMVHLREKLLENKLPVFFTSLCVSSYATNRYPIPKIWREYPHLCVKCRDCEKDYKNVAEGWMNG